MVKHGWFFPLTLLVLMMMVQPVHAKALQCSKVVMSGETGWPPFSYLQEGQLVGAGVDLAKVLLHELNIPVEVRTFLNQSDLEQALRSGEVDLLVGTYDVPRYDKITRLVIPPYFEDTLALVVPRGQGFEFSDWHHLMGHTGVTPKNMQLGRELIDFSRTYLNIQAVGDLRYDFAKLAHGDYDYIIGSAQMLKSGMNQFGNDNFEFLPMLVSAENIHFAFSENSPCKVYTYYFRSKIEELSKSNLIYTLVQNYVSPSQEAPGS